MSRRNRRKADVHSSATDESYLYQLGPLASYERSLRALRRNHTSPRTPAPVRPLRERIARVFYGTITALTLAGLAVLIVWSEMDGAKHAQALLAQRDAQHSIYIADAQGHAIVYPPGYVMTTHYGKGHWAYPLPIRGTDPCPAGSGYASGCLIFHDYAQNVPVIVQVGTEAPQTELWSYATSTNDAGVQRIVYQRPDGTYADPR